MADFNDSSEINFNRFEDKSVMKIGEITFASQNVTGVDGIPNRKVKSIMSRNGLPIPETMTVFGFLPDGYSQWDKTPEVGDIKRDQFRVLFYESLAQLAEKSNEVDESVDDWIYFDTHQEFFDFIRTLELKKGIDMGFDPNFVMVNSSTDSFQASEGVMGYTVMIKKSEMLEGLKSSKTQINEELGKARTKLETNV